MLVEANGGGTWHGAERGVFGVLCEDTEYETQEIRHLYAIDSSNSCRLKFEGNNKARDQDSIWLYMPQTGGEYEMTWSASEYRITSTELADFIKSMEDTHMLFTIRLRNVSI
jgi:hypothetical protein